MKEISEKEFNKILESGQENENEITITDISLKGACILDKKIGSYICMTNCNFENVVFKNCILYKFRFENCTFHHCEFLDMQIKNNQHTFTMGDCSFNHCFIHNLEINAVGEESDIVGTRFYKTKLSNNYFYVNVCIGQCNFEECILENNEIRMNELGNSILEKLIIKNLKIRAGFSNNVIKNTKMQDCLFDMDELSNWA